MKEIKTTLPILEGKCPPERNPETGEMYYPEPGTKSSGNRMINGIDVDELLDGLQCCKSYGDCGKCPYKDNSQEGCNRNRMIRETITVINKLTEKIDEYRKMTRDIFEILEGE